MKRFVFASMAVCLAAVGVHLPRERMNRATYKLKETDDIYPFPEPKQLKTLSLGYKSALADLLWAKLKVEYGVHWSEKREFVNIPNYFDAILELEPGYPPVFEYADTFLVYRPLRGTEQDARLARAYLERGTRERPYDPNVWLGLGKYLAFLSRTFLTSQPEIDAWRADGARAMMRGVELGGDVSSTLSAASILTRGGETKAAIASLRRALAISEEPSQREAIEAKLDELGARREREDADRAIKLIEPLWRTKARGLSYTAVLLMWPAPDPGLCAGVGGSARTAQQSRECARGWDALLPKDELDSTKP